MKHRITVGFVAAAAFMLVSCAASPLQGAPGATELATAGSPLGQATEDDMPMAVITSAAGKKAVVRTGESTAPREPGQRHGVLETDGAGCMLLRDQSGYDYTLIFPAGTRFDGEAVALPGGTNFSEGLRVAVRGALVPANVGVSMCENYMRLFSVDTAIPTPMGAGGATPVPR